MMRRVLGRNAAEVVDAGWSGTRGALAWTVHAGPGQLAGGSSRRRRPSSPRASRGHPSGPRCRMSSLRRRCGYTSRTSSTVENGAGLLRRHHCSWGMRTRSVTDSGGPFGFDQMTSGPQDEAGLVDAPDGVPPREVEGRRGALSKRWCSVRPAGCNGHAPVVAGLPASVQLRAPPRCTCRRGSVARLPDGFSTRRHSVVPPTAPRGTPAGSPPTRSAVVLAAVGVRLGRFRSTGRGDDQGQPSANGNDRASPDELVRPRHPPPVGGLGPHQATARQSRVHEAGCGVTGGRVQRWLRTWVPQASAGVGVDAHAAVPARQLYFRGGPSAAPP